MKQLWLFLVVAGLALAARGAALAQGPGGVLTSCASLSAVPLLNTGFEEGASLPTGWVPGNQNAAFTFARVTDRAHDGAASAYIRVPPNGPITYPNFGQTFVLTNPDRGLQFGAWVRTRGVTAGAGAYLALDFLDAHSNRIDFMNSADFLKGDSDWSYLTVRAGTLPHGTRSVQIALLLNGRGEAWFDSVSVMQITPSLVPPPTAVSLLNAGFEEGTSLPTAWVPANQGAGFTFARVTDRVHDGAASAYIRVPGSGPVTFPNFSQSFALTNPSSGLRFGGWISTRGVTSGAGAYLAVNYLDASSNRIDFTNSTDFVKGNSDWTYVTVQAGAIPRGTRFIQISLLLNGRGEAWFDSVSAVTLVPLTSAAEQPPTEVRLTQTEEVLQQPFFGFGVQNNPFLYMPENPSITEADRALVEARLRALQPRHVRVFFLTTWWGTTFDTPRIRSLLRLLQFYQSIGSDINLCLVDWDRVWKVDSFPMLVQKVRGLLDYLVRQQSLTHVRYLTLYNEPDLEPDLPDADAYVRLYQMMHDALQAAHLPIDLVGADVASSDLFFSSVVPSLAPLVGVYSYHDYPDYQSRFDFDLLARDRLATVATAGGGKPLFLWETNVHGANAGTFTPGQIAPSVLVLDAFDPATSLAQFALDGMNQGIAGISYWEAYDMQYGGGARMRYGLWAYKDEGWRLRPVYYVYALLTRLTQSGAAVIRLEAAKCEQNLPAAALRNPDGTRTVYVVNPWQTAVPLRLDGLPSAWKPRRYLITESAVTRLIQASALFAEESAVALAPGEIQDQLPPRSMVAYSDAR